MSDAPPAVSVKGLEVRLGRHVALTGLDFALPEGGFLAIVGPNGAGKSTLIRALLGVQAPQAGEVRLFGHPAGRNPGRQVGYIPQIKTLDRQFPALPLELVVSGIRGSWPWLIRRSERERAMEALRIVGMEQKMHTPIGQLSGGELQRIYLARSFVRHPHLLLLDEPATGMDALGEADMYRLLEGYRSRHQATIVMITHDWDVARHHASHVLLLNRRQVGFGSPSDVLVGDSLRHAYGHVGHSHPMTVPEDHDA